MLYRNKITGVEVDAKVPYTAEGWEPATAPELPAVVSNDEELEEPEIVEDEPVEELEVVEEPEPAKKRTTKKK